MMDHLAVKAQGAAALLDSANLEGLAHLRLRGNRFGSGSARLFARAAGPPHLAVLDLSHNWIGDAGARALAGAAWLERLTVLDVRNNGLGDEGRRALRERFGGRVQV